LDAKGRPIRLPDTFPTIEGTVVHPGIGGGTNWQSPSWSPLTRLFYVMAHENQAQTYFKMKEEYRPGESFEGGGFRNLLGDEPPGAVKAIEAETGKIRWEFKTHSYVMAGVLSTAGGLVFGSSGEGHFFALDAKSGKPLWRFQTGARIQANPISYAVDGKQHVAIASGQALFVFAID
jgi:alcohol dehydrogenase (cytochrome c)